MSDELQTITSSCDSFINYNRLSFSIRVTKILVRGMVDPVKLYVPPSLITMQTLVAVCCLYGHRQDVPKGMGCLGPLHCDRGPPEHFTNMTLLQTNMVAHLRSNGMSIHMKICQKTRNSAITDRPRDAFRGHSRSPNMVPFHM